LEAEVTFAPICVGVVSCAARGTHEERKLIRHIDENTARRRAVLLALSLALVACGDAAEKENNGAAENNGAMNNGTENNGGAANNGAGALEVAGTWTTNYDTSETLSDTEWNGSAIVEFDNDANFAITQNAEDAMYDPGKFNKLVWTEPAEGSFYYCTVDFSLETADDAKNTTKTADDSDPLNSGCGDFGWTMMTAAE
jgi:hypothetical protein